MALVDLIFSLPPATSGDLVFGDTGSGPSLPDVSLEGASRISGMRFKTSVARVAVATGSGTITGMRVVLGTVYDVDVSRPTIGMAGDRFQQAQGLVTGVGSDYQQSQPLSIPSGSRFQKAAPITAGIGSAWEDSRRSQASYASRYQDGLNLQGISLASSWQRADSLLCATRIQYQEGLGLLVAASARFQRGLSVRRGQEHRYQEAVRLLRAYRSDFSSGVGLRHGHRVRYQEAWTPRPGSSALIPVVPPIEPPCYVPSTLLVFSAVAATNGDLLFVCEREVPVIPPETRVVPARKVYFIVNTLQMKRVSDNIPIEVKSISLGTDKRSWAWSFTGTIHAYDLEKVEPTSSGPVEIEVMINDVKWRFLVEEYDTAETFAANAVTIRGRSSTALLSAPYAPVRSFVQSSALTSRQYAEAELSRPGLDTGFTLDWLLPDELGWSLPAHTWSYQDLTPMDVISQLVQGGGGFVNSHPELRKVMVRPEYRYGFWDWGTAAMDVILPRSHIRGQSLKWMEKPLYNGVYVSGENTGVSALVRKLGTLGEFQAPPFMGPMISDNIAARLVGLSILSSGGKQAEVGLEMPMSTDVGLVTPGMMIEVVSGGIGPDVPQWRGQVSGTTVSAAWNDTLTVSQAVVIERHYGGF